MLDKYTSQRGFPRLTFDTENYQRWVAAIKEKVMFFPLEFSDAIANAIENIKSSRKHWSSPLGFSIICLKDANNQNVLVIPSPFVVCQPGSNGVIKVAIVIYEKLGVYDIDFSHPMALKIIPKERNNPRTFDDPLKAWQKIAPKSEISFAWRYVKTIYKNYMLIPLFPGCDLQKFYVQWCGTLKSNTANLRERCQIAIAIIMALQEIHEHSFVHMDVKAENILIYRKSLQDRFEAHLIDFDDILPREKLFARFIGTPYYMPPEIIINQKSCSELPAAFTLDIFSLGFSLIILFIGGHVFKKRTAQPDLFCYDDVLADTTFLDSENSWQKIAFTDQCSGQAIKSTFTPVIDVLKKMVQQNPNDRPPLAEVLTAFRQVETTVQGITFKNKCGYVAELPAVENMQILKYSQSPEYSRVKPVTPWQTASLDSYLL